MPHGRKVFELRNLKHVYSIAVTAGLVLMAAGSSAAQDQAPVASEAGPVTPPLAAGCENGAFAGALFVVPKAGGGTRSMEICNVGDRGDPAATARALSDAIDAERGKDKFYAHPKMPDLLVLRVTRARADVDPSLSVGERRKMLASINAQIDELESDISKSVAPRDNSGSHR